MSSFLICYYDNFKADQPSAYSVQHDNKTGEEGQNKDSDKTNFRRNTECIRILGHNSYIQGANMAIMKGYLPFLFRAISFSISDNVPLEKKGMFF